MNAFECRSGSASESTTPGLVQDSAVGVVLTDEQLLERLEDVAVLQQAATRRQRFMDRRADVARVRTQPITYIEMTDADK